MVHVCQQCTALAGQGPASAQQSTGRAPLSGGTRGLREPAPTHTHRNVMRVDCVVFRLPPVEGLQRAGMTEDNREPMGRPEVRKPGPGQQACGRQDDSARGRARSPCAARLGWRSCSGGTVLHRPESRMHRDHGAGSGDRCRSTRGAVWCRMALRSPPCSFYGFCHSQHTTEVCWGGGLNKYQPLAGDAQQPRSASLRLLGRA